MKLTLPFAGLCLLATSLTTAGPLSKLPDAKAVNPKAVTFAQETHPWSISAGVTVRSIDADFHLSAPPMLNTSGLVHQKRGRGDVGLFNGGSSKVYDNGSVGPDLGVSPIAGTPPPTGDAVANGGSVRSTGRVDSFGNPLSTFDFFTHSYSYLNSFDSRNVDVSSSDVGVGPYLEISRRVVDRASLIMDIFAGWNYVQTTHSSGDHVLARQSVVQHDVRHTYSYDGVTTADFGAITGFPDASGIVIYDTALDNAAFGTTGYINPHQTNKATNSLVGSFYAVTRGDLDVRLNEIPIGFKVGRKFGRLSLLAELGGTINVISYDLDASTSWYRSTGGTQSRQTWSDSSSPLKAGLFGGVSAQCDLTTDGRLFLEAHGTYRWVDAVHAAAGPVSTEIDVSSWEGGLSVGWRL